MPTTLITDYGFADRLAELGMATRTMFNAREVARIFDRNEDTVYRWAAGELDGAINVSGGGRVKRVELRFPRAAIERFWQRRILL